MDIQYKAAVSIVKDYSDYLEFICELRGYSLEQLSYAKWTVNEILKKIRVQQSLAPLAVIEEFRDKMYEYLKYSKKSFIFYVAYDTANEIIDCFL